MSKSIAQKTTKRTPTSTPDLDRPIKLHPVSAPQPDTFRDALAAVYRQSRGGTLESVVGEAADDLMLVIRLLEHDPNIDNVPDAAIRQLIEIFEVLYAVRGELEALASGKAVA